MIQSRILFGAIFSLAVLSYLALGLLPEGAATTKEIYVPRGMSVREISNLLYEEELLRSPLFFRVSTVLTGTALKLRPGVYLLHSSLSPFNIAYALTEGGGEEVEVVIKEGETIFGIDALLAESGVIKAGELIALHADAEYGLEGFLFPDTYRFLIDSDPSAVAAKFTDNFKKKAPPKIVEREEGWYDALILASLLEREVPDFEERRLVAGILKKRLRNGWPLQVDAVFCYIKEPEPCYPLSALDLKIDSRYNTYIYKGLPPTPIGNPGVEAMRAALSPKE